MQEMDKENAGRAGEMSGATVSDRKYRLLFAAALSALILVMVASLCIGRYGVGVADCVKILLSGIFHFPETWTKTMYNVVMVLRLPRVLTAAMVGAGLAISGAAYQSMFKNPMVSPDILGVSSGASIGACLAILLGLGSVVTQSWAFIGGMAAVLITAAVPRILKSSSPVLLVLAGIITGGLMSSALGIIRYIAMSAFPDSTILADMTYWTMGSFSKAGMDELKYIAPVVLISGGVLVCIRYRLNVLSLGESEAKTLGINVSRLQLIIILASTLVTASCVCVSGTIGWVGLVVPHLSRMVVGPDNRKMLPFSLLLGAMFMVVVDTLCRSISSAEIPVSIITGLVGAPFYFYLLYRQRMSMR